MKQTVAVAMSGGVDSSYALLKLKEEGYDVFGVTLKLFCYGESSLTPKSCCSLDSIKDARGVCSAIGVSHMVVDATEIFGTEVLDYFVLDYSLGLTPNPCVKCNSAVKWGYLLKKVLAYGADFLATGHYARVSYSEERKRFLLLCGLDMGKDQSYYLWPLNQEQLKRTLFPLGEMTKEDVKKEMKKYDLKISEKPESQEICFIPDDDYRKFLREKGVSIPGGNIVNSHGEIIGRHEGFPFYTIGQRRGLGVAFSERLYVKRIEPQKNEITLGLHDELYSKELLFSKTNFISSEEPPEDMLFKARIRYRGNLQDCRLKKLDERRFLLDFTDPVWGICPGQSVVLYDGPRVVGGGLIEK